MKSQKEQPDPRPERRRPAYETSDVRLRGAVVAVVLFIVFAAVTHVWLYFLWLADAEPTRPVDYPRSVMTDGFAPSAEPPLQPTQQHDRLPSEDLVAMHRRENAVFAALGWKVAPGTALVDPPEALIRIVASRQGQSATQPATRPSQEVRP